jgi:hypothetical protein
VEINAHISILLRDVKEPPYVVAGTYQGTTRLDGDGRVFIIVLGQSGDNINKLIYVPEPLVHTITKYSV